MAVEGENGRMYGSAGQAAGIGATPGGETGLWKRFIDYMGGFLGGDTWFDQNQTAQVPVANAANQIVKTDPPPVEASALIRWLGGKDAATGNEYGGIIPGSIGALTGVANAYLGYKQLGMAEDAFNEQKSQWNRNFNRESKMLNANLRDRQASRRSFGGNKYQSVGDYMKQNGV